MSFLADVIKHCSYSLNSSIKSWYLLGGVGCGKATGERGLKGNWRHHLMCSWSDFDWPLHNNMANLPYGPWSPTFLLSPGFTPAFHLRANCVRAKINGFSCKVSITFSFVHFCHWIGFVSVFASLAPLFSRF